MEELLPCPFCGSTDITMGAFDIAPECSVECKKCGAGIYDSVPWRKNDTIETHDERCWKKLTRKWNRRTPTEREDGEND